MRPSTNRIDALDVIRGLVMVLMAIDHVRVYSGLPAGGPTAGIFFTRWVTHFCAPAFAFLAGTSAFLQGQRIGVPALRAHLFKRGLLLVLLEPTLIRFTWTFNVHVEQFALAGVIWMLGWCMVLLAGLVGLRARTIAVIGLLIVLGQQAFRFLPLLLPESLRSSVGWLLEFVYPGGLKTPDNVAVLYTIVPWIGVMAAGYAFGALLAREPDERRRWCWRIGLSATALFVVIGGLKTFLAPSDGSGLPALFAFLNPPKYPASQLFLLMTLGPTIALLPLAERLQGPVKTWLATFGRVPMFYYLLHIPLIHVAALAVNLARDGAAHAEWYATAPYAWVPPEQRWSLSLLYVVFVPVVAILYAACRWFAGVKARRATGWLRYV